MSLHNLMAPIEDALSCPHILTLDREAIRENHHGSSAKRVSEGSLHQPISKRIIFM